MKGSGHGGSEGLNKGLASDGDGLAHGGGGLVTMRSLTERAVAKEKDDGDEAAAIERDKELSLRVEYVREYISLGFQIEF